MPMSRWRQGVLPAAAIAGVYVLFLVLVPPTGEFPWTDDFDYAATAWHLAETGQLRLSDWPAMTLIGHVVWGSLFAVVGGSSFFVLRLSMFCVSALTAWTLYLWTRRCGHGRELSVWFAVTFAVMPLTVCMQYSFMTDLSGVALAALLLLVAPRWDSEANWRYLGYGTLAGVAYLTRETASIPFLVYCGLAFFHVQRRNMPARSFLCLLIPFVVAVVGYYLWLNTLHGVPRNRTGSMLMLASITHHTRRLYFVSALLAIRLLPVSVLLLTRAGVFRDRKAWCVAIALVTALAGTTYLLTGDLPHSYGEDLFDLGVRPPELSSGGQPDSMRGPELHWGGHSISLFGLLVRLATPACLVVFCQWLIAERRNIFGAQGLLCQRITLSGLTFLATLALMLVVRSYMNRYTLALMPLAMMFIAGVMAVEKSPRRMAAAWVMTAIVGLWSLVGIQDGMQRSGAFFAAVEEVHRRGIDPAAVDGGLAYVGYYRFNPQYRGAENVGPFLLGLSNVLPPDEFDAVMAAIWPATIFSDRPIVVSFKKEPGHDVLATTSYRSWFRSGKVYVLLNRSKDRRRLAEPIQRWLSERE